MFTHAELALALIVLRRQQGLPDEMAPVSDKNWRDWTGLSPRAKEYAASGLKKKCLRIEGRGDSARYHFQRQEWESFVLKARAGQRLKPRTDGRGVTAKPGAMVHPQCRERGCALLASQDASGCDSGLTLVMPTQIAQPVAQTASASPPISTPPPPPLKKQSSTVVATPIAQPVAQTQGLQLVWPNTYAALRAIFPMVGTDFLARLVNVVRSHFGAAVVDDPLSKSVQLAFERKRHRQESEGLFLLTVPEALAVILKRPAPAAAPEISTGLATRLEGWIRALRERGAPYDTFAVELERVRAQLDAPGFDLEAIEAQLAKVEASIFQAARAALIAGESAEIEQAISEFVKPYTQRMKPDQVGAIRDRARVHETLRFVGLPRFSLA